MPSDSHLCAEHGALLVQLRHVSEQLAANVAGQEKLLEKLESLVRALSRSDANIRHLEQSVADLKLADSEQWSAINAMRRLVYAGMGIALALNAVAVLLATLGGRLP